MTKPKKVVGKIGGLILRDDGRYHSGAWISDEDVEEFINTKRFTSGKWRLCRDTGELQLLFKGSREWRSFSEHSYIDALEKQIVAYYAEQGLLDD